MFPENWSLRRIFRHAICEYLTDLKIVKHNQEKIMSALDDLKAALGDTSSKVSKLATDVDAFIQANSGGATDADLQAVTAAVSSVNTAIDAIDAKVAPTA